MDQIVKELKIETRYGMQKYNWSVEYARPLYNRSVGNDFIYSNYIFDTVCNKVFKYLLFYIPSLFIAGKEAMEQSNYPRELSSS